MLPASGLYARHVRDLTLNALDLSATAGEGRPAVILDDVVGARVAKLTSTPIRGRMPMAQLIQCKDVQIADPAGAGRSDGIE